MVHKRQINSRSFSKIFEKFPKKIKTKKCQPFATCEVGQLFGANFLFIKMLFYWFRLESGKFGNVSRFKRGKNSCHAISELMKLVFAHVTRLILICLFLSEGGDKNFFRRPICVICIELSLQVSIKYSVLKLNLNPSGLFMISLLC